MPEYYGSLTNQLGTTANTDSLLRWDHTLFDNFTVPVGMDRDTALAVIMRLHGLAPLYRPDPYWMKDAIKWWCKECLPIWEKLYSTTQLVYNPIWNTDVSERTTDVRTIDRDTTDNTTKISRGDTHGTGAEVHTDKFHTTTDVDDTSNTTTVMNRDVNGTDKTVTDQTKNLDQTVTRDISPENAPDYQPDDQTHTTATETLKSTVDGTHSEKTEETGNSTTIAHSSTVSDGSSSGDVHTENTGNYNDHSDGKAVGTEDVTETYNHGWIKQGNIGVTTTQQMIEAERETVLFDVYKVIADDYHAKFCLDVY